MRWITGAVALATLLVPAAAFADTIRVVPGEGNPIQEAFDAAQDGDVILITKGAYPAGASLSGRADITVRGVGKPVIEDTTGEAHGLSFGNVAGLTIQGLVLRNTGYDGLYFDSCSDVAISKCAFEEIGQAAIEDRHSVGFAVARCSVDGAGAGFVLSANQPDPGTSGIVVKRNRFLDTLGTAIDFKGEGAVVMGNRILSIGLGGIVAQSGASTTGALIEGNRVESVQYGISVAGSGHVVARNRVAGCQSDGLTVVSPGGCTVESNVITDCAGYGMRIDSMGNVVRRNRISGSGLKDLGSSVLEENNTYEKNRYETSQFGISEGPPI